MLKIGIIITSIREGRVGLDVAKWTLLTLNELKIDGVDYELVDLQNYNLPLLGSPHALLEQKQAVNNWQNKMASFDGHIFVVAEYNHLLTGAIKNAMDFLKAEVANKVASFVGYGAFGGARAIESFRMMMGELQVACTQKTVNFNLATDFENYTILKPQAHHVQALAALVAQNKKWATALKSVR